MLGGTVIGIARGSEGHTLLHVRGTGSDRHESCAVRCVERRLDGGGAVEIKLGDSVWWQGKTLLWTPAGVRAAGAGCGLSWDVRLRKVGFLHGLGRTVLA